jgi:hypothetical protein
MHTDEPAIATPKKLVKTLTEFSATACEIGVFRLLGARP